MVDFDELIKEKVDQANYPCKKNAWKQFASRNGLRIGLSSWQIVAVSIVSVLVAGGITWAVIHTSKTQPTPSVTPESIVVTEDTPSVVEVDTAKPEHHTLSETPVAHKKLNKPTAPANDLQSEVKSTQTLEVKQSKKKEVVKHGLPVIISADTITQMQPTDEQLRKGNSRIF